MIKYIIALMTLMMSVTGRAETLNEGDILKLTFEGTSEYIAIQKLGEFRRIYSCDESDDCSPLLKVGDAKAFGAYSEQKLEGSGGLYKDMGKGALIGAGITFAVVTAARFGFGTLVMYTGDDFVSGGSVAFSAVVGGGVGAGSVYMNRDAPVKVSKLEILSAEVTLLSDNFLNDNTGTEIRIEGQTFESYLAALDTAFDALKRSAK